MLPRANLFALSALATAGLYYYYKLSPRDTMLVFIGAVVSLHLVQEKVSLVQSVVQGGGGVEDNRLVRYGDKITLWGHQHRFLRMYYSDNRRFSGWGRKRGSVTEYVGSSSRLSVPEEIPRAWYREFFTLERAGDKRWTGAETPLRYGDKVRLRSWRTRWVSPAKNGTVGSGGRGYQEVLTVESPDVSGNNGQPVRYGDAVYLKTWRRTYLNDRYWKTRHGSKNETSVFNIYDTYGQGSVVDWASRGYATQESQYKSFSASNVIDGNPLSFHHTQNKDGAWIQVELPRDINISQIVVHNRKRDRERLHDFDVIVSDSKGKPVHTHYFKDTQDKYEISGINSTGRNVKVQLRGKNFLHLTNISVYGTPVQYSSLVETPVVGNIITEELPLAHRVYHHEAIPYIGKNNSMSMSFFIKPKSGSGILVSQSDMTLTLIGNKLHVIPGAPGSAGPSIKASSSINANVWSHIALVVTPKISPKSGWLYGEFKEKPDVADDKCCYAVHPFRKEYYHLKEQGEFSSASKNLWTASVVKGMKYLGELHDDDNVSTIELYVNGLLDTKSKLENMVQLNNGPLIVAQEDGAGVKGLIKMLRFYNYSIDEATVHRDSRLQHNVMALGLTTGITDASIVKTVSPHLLPTNTGGVSVGLWLYSARPVKGKWDIVFRKGRTDSEKAPGLWFTPEGRLYAPVTTHGGKSGGDGLKEIKHDIKRGTWYHVTEILDGRTQKFYLNGEKVGSIELPGDITHSVSPVHIGGFKGKIKGFRFYNFALSDTEVREHMGMHPEHKIHDSIQKIWHEQGCTTDLFEDLEANSDLVGLMKLNKSSDVEDKLKAIKTAATKGDKAKLVQCYGPYASKLLGKLQKSGELLEHAMKQDNKKCLPVAPFYCKNKGVNDFDIRAHKDFHKYTNTDKIIPPIQSLSDVDITKHPDYIKYSQQLAESKKALGEMSKLRVASENKNKELVGKLGDMEKHGFTSQDVLKHPLYAELQAKYKAEQAKLKSLAQGEEATELSLQRDSQAVLESPEYKKQAAELKKAREQAVKNLVGKTMSREELLNNPVFKDIIQEYKLTDAGLQRELEETNDLANNVYSGLAGMDSKTVDDILKSKTGLSGDAEYQGTVDSMKDFNNRDIRNHPEYQKLVQKLNTLTQSQVTNESGKYQDFKVQAKKCQAMFEKGDGATIPTETLLKIFKERSEKDPAFKALLSNIVESRSSSDASFRDILEQARNGKYTDDPEFKKFLKDVSAEQINTDPVYRKVATSMVPRLEDHPEYNKYASDIRRESCKGGA